VQLEALQQQLAQQVNVTPSPSGAAAAAAAARREDKAGGRVGSLLSHQLLQRPQQLNLTLQEACALQQYQPMVEAWGWRVSLTATAAAAAAGEAAAGATTNVGITQPAVLQQVPVLAGITLGAVDLQVCWLQCNAGWGSPNRSWHNLCLRYTFTTRHTCVTKASKHMHVLVVAMFLSLSQFHKVLLVLGLIIVMLHLCSARCFLSVLPPQ
jgi:hypothetical protein